MTDDKVQVEFGAQTGELNSGVNQVKGKIGELGSEVQKAEELFTYLGERMIEVFAIHEITNFIGEISELGEQALRSSAMLGMSVEEVQNLGFAAKMTGGDADSMAMSMGRFERNIAEAQNGTGKAYEAFKSLGVSLEDLKNKTPDELLGQVADKFSTAADGARKYAFAVDLGGRTWGSMIPLLDKGSEGLQQMGVIAQQTGSILSGSQAEAFEKTHQAITIFKSSVEGAGVAIFGTLEPAIDVMLSGFTYAVQDIAGAIDKFREFQTVIGADLIIAMGLFVRAIKDLGAEAGLVADKIVVTYKTAGAELAAIATGQWGSIKDIWEESGSEMEAATKKATDAIRDQDKAFQDLKSSAEKAAAQIMQKPGEQSSSKPQLPGVPDPAAAKAAQREQEELAREEVSYEEQMGKLSIANEKTILDEKVSLGEISNKEKYAQLNKLMDDEYTLENEALVKESNLSGLTVVEKQKIDDQMLILHRKYLNDKDALTRKSLDDEKKQYDQVFQGINRAFTTSINGILLGTQTWQQATANIFTGILSVFVDMAEKMVAKWIESMVMQAIYGKTEGASQIATNAATAGAGAYSATAVIPYVGPILAPGAAAMAYADTMAFQGGLASFAVGSWDLPNDQIAQVHQGEMIIPKTFADSVRENGGIGGGGGDTYHIHAVDAQSFVNMLKSNSATITGIMKNGTRNFSSNLRPAG